MSSTPIDPGVTPATTKDRTIRARSASSGADFAAAWLSATRRPSHSTQSLTNSLVGSSRNAPATVAASTLADASAR